MNRRSILGTHGTAPVRLDEVDFPSAMKDRPTQSRRSSIVPQSRGLHGTRVTQSGNRKNVQPPVLRRQLYGKPNDLSSSVLSGISVLGESVLESSELVPVPPNPQSETNLRNINVTSRVRSPIKSSGSHQNVKKSNIKPSKIESGSKLRQPTVFSVQKRGSDTGLNSTQTFEQEEIAALTSTPCVKSGLTGIAASVCKPSGDIDCAALVEQMKLLATEQRNAVQVMKLSFQKINTLLDKQVELVTENKKLFQDLRNFVAQNLEVSSAANVTKHCEDSTVIIKAHDNNVKEPQEFPNQFICDKEVPKESQMEGKENDFLSKPAQRSLSVYVDLKSQMNCLKTPTLNRSLQLQSITACTPRTLLSNAVQNQLENLFEVSETDE